MNDIDKLNFDSNEAEIDISSYITNSFWDLKDKFVEKSNTSERHFFIRSNKTKSYSDDMAFALILKRKSIYFMVNSLLPSLILNFLTILAYALPFHDQIGLSKTQIFEICF